MFPEDALRVSASEIPSTLTEYDRADWKQWTDADCQDARREVLVAESRTDVGFQPDRQRRVATGEWVALYTNTVVTDPGRLDIDHMVPLGNAHRSGAWKWPPEQKERYAHFLDDPEHLVAVTAGGNRSKVARGPLQWKPADQGYWCQYAIDWISIKSAWNLTLTEPELKGLNQMLYTCDEPPGLWVSHGSVPGEYPTDKTSEPFSTRTPTSTGYNSCDAAQAAGEIRIQESEGSGREFPTGMVPGARDGDGVGVMCAR